MIGYLSMSATAHVALDFLITLLYDLKKDEHDISIENI
jgi:hypothetical protein